MNYFIDFKFQEDFVKPLFGKRRHFIDLISVGVTSEDERSLYLIGKEFDLRRVWNDDWLRENVSKPIYNDYKALANAKDKVLGEIPFTAKGMRTIVNEVGYSNKEIARHIFNFVNPYILESENIIDDPIHFYGYYCDYDWVLLCSLYGKMIDLPKGFPMYCRDLQQVMDERGLSKEWVRATLGGFESGHNALADAVWIRKLYRALNNQSSFSFPLNYTK